MGISIATRLLLLLLLPVIALFLYYDSLKYDPGLLDFKKERGGEDEFADLFPNKIDTFKKSDKLHFYLSNNLYEYVNGHAEYFISAGFKKLAVADYFNQESESVTPDMVVNIFNMAKAVNAFGVLMEEVSPDSEEISVGAKGYISDRTVSFINGPFYIKINSFGNNAPLLSFAKAVAKSMGSLESGIALLDKLPKKNALARSLKFHRENYRGLSFIKNVLEQSYKTEDQKEYAISVTEEKNETEMNGTIQKYLDYFKSEEITYELKKYKDFSYYSVQDPFEGEWALLPDKTLLFAIYHSGDEIVAQNSMGEIRQYDITKK